MSAAATLDPTPPSHSGRLLNLVRKLIDYGKELAATLRQRSGSNDSPNLRLAFGIADIALILSRITQGLHRARLLEQRIVRIADSLDADVNSAPPHPRRPSLCATDTASSQRTQARTEDPDPRLAYLPTPKEIAAKVRRQRIGAVLADICRDLGILPSHPLWRELHYAITKYDGNYTRLMIGILNQAFSVAHIEARLKCAPVAPPEPACTGPPSAVPGIFI